MALPKKNKIVLKTDFDRIFKLGKAVKGSFLLIRFLDNNKDFPRFGFIVSKNISSRAVDRNRLKRVMSEIALRFLQEKKEVGLDIVVAARSKKEDSLILELSKFLKNF